MSIRLTDSCGAQREIDHIEFAYRGEGCSFGANFDLSPSLTLEPYGSGDVILEYPTGACSPGASPSKESVRARFTANPGYTASKPHATYTGPMAGYSLSSTTNTGGSSASTSAVGTTGGSGSNTSSGGSTATTTISAARPLPLGSWTVVVQSRIASESGARTDVESAAEQARRAGYTVHVIDTDAYPSLRPGVIAAITGTYSSCLDAKAAAQTVQLQLGTDGENTYQRYLSEDTSFRDATATKC
jgi:hypothetical protein